MEYLIAAGFFTALLALVSTKLLLAIARHYKIIDKANFRSLHTGSVPRGGGAAVAFSVMSALLLIQILQNAQGSSFYFPVFVVFGMALLGFVEDVVGVPVILRFAIQLLAGVLLTLLAREVNGEDNFYPMFVLLVVSFVWCVNGSNFMDGSDGLLASQATLIFGFAAFAAMNSTELMEFAVYPTIMAAACLGFLYWNWQQAEIFLGDVGSYFIGAGFGAALIYSPQFNVPRVVLLILLIPLLTDATLTVLRRAVARKRIWEAHREHAYQLWILSGVSHRRIAIFLGFIFCAIFAPLAYLALTVPDWSFLILVIATTVGIALWLGGLRLLPNKSRKNSL